MRQLPSTPQTHFGSEEERRHRVCDIKPRCGFAGAVRKRLYGRSSG
jgi:hypothetical protein